MEESGVATSTIVGKVYVVGDNIDTDQIIPAEYLSLVPTIPQEYIQLGGYALSGLPSKEYPTRLVEPGKALSEYVVIIAGRNFGCGSSRGARAYCFRGCGNKGGCRRVLCQDFLS